MLIIEEAQSVYCVDSKRNLSWEGGKEGSGILFVAILGGGGCGQKVWGDFLSLFLSHHRNVTIAWFRAWVTEWSSVGHDSTFEWSIERS